MRKIIIFFVLAGLGIWSIAQARGLDARILQDHGSSITLEFQLNDYTIEPTQINGNAYSKVLIQGQPPLLEKGMPELPIFVSSIIIPNDAHMDYRIIDIEYETIKIDPVVPSKGNLYRNINPADIPYTFAKFYQTNTWWPEKTIELDRPFILRDYRGLSVRFNPFQFNPATKELKIAKRVIIEVYEAGKSSINVLTKTKNIATREFVNIYDDFFLNFSQARYDSISERAGRMVIICADAFMSNMASFKTWKRMKGIETKMVTISSIGNNETAIKTFIQNEYNAGDLVWVLLVGDGNEVVPATGNMGSASGQDADPVYAYTAGGDYYPDIFISRFSSRGGNSTNIDKQASRSIGYEQTPQTGADWYHVGLGVASNEGSPPDYERCNWLRDSLLNYHYTQVKDQYQGQGGSTSGITTDIEAGLSIINYIGHGSTSGWASVSYSISNVSALNNPWMLPFVISVACLVGNFNGSDCYCEASVTAGTVSDPDGFLVHWGSTISQSWVPPCYGQEGAVNLLTHDKKNTAGGIFFNGACYMIEHYGSTNPEGIDMAQTWTIFGDASLQLRTDTPQSMTVNHASAIFLGQTTFDVSTPGVQNALVGLYIDTLSVGHGYTNAAGNVTITLDPPPSSPGTMYITVTAYNRIPYLGSVPITSSSGPYVVLGTQIIDDASGGNNDGVVNPGETIDYGIYGKNVGTSTAYSVFGLLSETDPYVSLSIDSSWFGNIAVDDSSLSSPYYQFTVATNCPNNHGISFSLEFHDTNDTVWTATPSVTVYAPVLTYQDVSIIGGNGNGILDPGETTDVVITIENEGGATAASVTSTLMTSSSYITINDASGNFGTINPGNTANNAADPYTVTASPSTPYGTEIDFEIEVVSGIYLDTLGFTLVVGQLVPSDTGLYYAYYSGGPHLQSPVFEWFAIDSTQTQNPGTSTNIGDDAVVQVNLPFTFTYYGIDYTQLTIGSDGWVAMGYQTQYDQTNSPIPDSDGPSGMVAGLWDDLDPGNSGEPSDVYYYHDAANNRYIVEWFRCEHWPSGFYETFEIMLYDPVVYPTPTGDGEIIVQYLVEMQESDNTLGIENFSETVGIQYYLNGAYHALAVPVTDSFAIKYTTYPPDWIGIKEQGGFASLPLNTLLGMMYPNPGLGVMSIRYQVAGVSDISLCVYDAAGRLVRTVTKGACEPGYYTQVWDARDDLGRRVPAGVYFIRFAASPVGETDDYQRVEKAVLLR